MRRNRIVLTAASLLLGAGTASAQRVDATRPRDYTRVYERAPDVNVWIDRYVFRSGERIRAYFESEPGAYVTILRVSTLGNVSVLYPRRPTVQRAYRERLSNDEVPYNGRPEFYLNEPEGVGIVFAIASFEPFDYSAFNSGGQWSMRRLVGSYYGDPYRAIDNFVAETLSPRAEYSSDYIQYEVLSGGRYRRYGYGYAGTESSWYTGRYFACLDYYGLQAISYCRSFAGSGVGGFPYIVFRSPRAPSPTTPAVRRQPKMAPPDRVIPDPGVADVAAKSAERSSRYSGVREAPSGPRIHVQTDGRRDAPVESRYSPSARVRAEPRHEPVQVLRYEPPRAPRNDPPPAQRYEPPRVEQRQESHPRVEQRQESHPRVELREHPTPVPQSPPPPAS